MTNFFRFGISNLSSLLDIGCSRSIDAGTSFPGQSICKLVIQDETERKDISYRQERRPRSLPVSGLLSIYPGYELTIQSVQDRHEHVKVRGSEFLFQMNTQLKDLNSHHDSSHTMNG